MVFVLHLKAFRTAADFLCSHYRRIPCFSWTIDVMNAVLQPIIDYPFPAEAGRPQEVGVNHTGTH